MPKGGARARSGPAPDPNSERSRKGRGASVAFSATALPSEGYDGEVPAFPLPLTYRKTLDGLGADEGGTEVFRERELTIWADVWATPQAAAWAREPYRWPTIAEFCRIKAAVEDDPDKSASLLARLREYRNEIGLSPDGMRMNGWAIAVDQLAAKAAESEAPAAAAPPAQRRLRSAPASS